MPWPHYPYVEGVYDRYNKLYKIAAGQSASAADHLAYPDRNNYQTKTLFANLQGAIRTLVGSPWIVYRDYSGEAAFETMTWAYVVANAPLPQGDWKRKYYREVHDDTDTEEIFGSADGGTAEAVANGQRAYRWSDRQIVDRIGGVWVPNYTATEPDIITSSGYMSQGDIIGDWLFSEMEAVLDLLGTIGLTGTWTAEHWIYAHSPDPASNTTAALGRSTAETAYAGASLDTFGYGGDGIRATNSMITNSTNDSFEGILYRTVGHGSQTALSDVAPSNVDFYTFGTSETGASGDFSDQGEAVLFQLLKKYDTATTDSGTLTATSVSIGNISNAPNDPWCADPVSPGTPTTYSGFLLSAYPYCAVKYSV
jgi:hypothetical protein